jgi:hypothetical protein
MKPLGLLLAVVAFSASAASAAAPPPSPVIAAPASVPAALYSFIDVYRLTVGRAPVGLPLTDENTEAPIRVALVETAPAVEPRFTVRQLPAPERWLLLLAGLVLAGWVAHRRLSYL